jgi:hypothetical protein
MRDVLHPIFDLAFDQLGERVDVSGRVLEAVAVDAAGLETIAAAQAADADPSGACIALGALAELLARDGHAGVAEALRGLCAERPEALRAVRDGAAEQRRERGRAAHAELFGAAPRRVAPAAPTGVPVGLGLRFRLQNP